MFVHAPMWMGAVLVVVAAGRAFRARPRDIGYVAVLVAAATNLAAEGWHTWAHCHNLDYGGAHLAMNLSAAAGAVTVSLVLLRSRRLGRGGRQ